MKKFVSFLLTLVCIALVVAIGYVALCFVKDDDVIWEHVRINGVSVAGLTREQAEEAVEENFKRMYSEAAFDVDLEGSTYPIPVYHALDIDPEAAVEDAYRYGHGQWYTRGYEWIRSELSKMRERDITVDPYVRDATWIADAIAESDIEDYNSVTESTYDIQENALIIHKGNTGSVADLEALENEILDNMFNGVFYGIIQCPTKPVDTNSIDFAAIAEKVHTDPQGPHMDVNYQIVSAIPGHDLDVAKAQQAFEAAAPGTDVTVAYELTESDMTTEEYTALLFRDKLASYTSQNYSMVGRNNNLSIACGQIDGTIVLPGDEFSYNDTVGPVDAEHGFMVADAYVEKKVVAEVGGGICQVASTIFASCMHTNLDITMRQCHSLQIGYIPMGLDATIYQPMPDFRFVNNRDYPVRINAVTTNGQVYVEIWGTKIEGEAVVTPQVNMLTPLSCETYRIYTDPYSGRVLDTEYVCRSEYKPHG